MPKCFRFLLLGVILCMGCVNTGSVNPFYTNDTLVPLPQLDGAWIGVETDEEGNESRTPIEIKEGRIIVSEENGTTNSATLVFFKVDDVLFADLQVQKDEGLQKIPPHLLFKIINEESQLTFIPFNYKWLEAHVISGEIKISYLREEGEEGMLFTATSQEWIEFILLNKSNNEIFSVDDQFVINRRE